MSATEFEIKVGDYFVLLPNKITGEHYHACCGLLTKLNEDIGYFTVVTCVGCMAPDNRLSHWQNTFFQPHRQSFKIITKEQAENPNFAKWIKASYNGN